MFGFNVDLGIDLGTANLVIIERGKGIVVQEPSVVTLDRKSKKVLAMGIEAKKMIGRTPDSIIAIRPLKEGVIANYEVTEAMLRAFFSKYFAKKWFFRPRIMICVPAGVTEVEKRAILEVALQMGASKAYLIEEPVAAALGADLDIDGASGVMVVDIGGGTTDSAVMSLGGMVVSESLRVGSDNFDDAIVRHVRKAHNLLIGESTAEQLKIAIGQVWSSDITDEKMIIKGRNALAGLPKEVEVSASEVSLAIEECVVTMIRSIKSLLERTPPELMADIIDKGVVLTGGGSMLKGFAERISKELDVRASLAENPLLCVASGTVKAFSNIGLLNWSNKNLAKQVNRR